MPCTRGFYGITGTLKVSSAAGLKWVPPEQVDTILRPLGSIVGSSEFQFPLTKGDAVQVWSESKKAWLDANILEVFRESCKIDGFSVPAGTVKVSSAAGQKWIMPENLHDLLREAKPSNSRQ